MVKEDNAKQKKGFLALMKESVNWVRYGCIPDGGSNAKEKEANPVKKPSEVVKS